MNDCLTLNLLSCFFTVAKKREIHAAVTAMFHEVWIVGEVVILAMFENEDTIVFQQLALEDEAGDGR